MRCFKCGADNPEGNDFCAECGQKLEKAESTAERILNAEQENIGQKSTEPETTAQESSEQMAAAQEATKPEGAVQTAAAPETIAQESSEQTAAAQEAAAQRSAGAADIYCQNCGAKLFSGSAFCSECGHPVSGPVNGVHSADSAPAPKKRGGHIAAWIIGIAAAIALALAIGAFMPSGGNIEGTWRQETAAGLDIFGSTYMTFDNDTVQYNNTFNRQTWNYKYFPVVNILTISDNDGNRAVWHIKWNGKDEFYIKENNLTFKRYYNESDSDINDDFDDFDDFFDDFFDDIPDTYDGSDGSSGSDSDGSGSSL